LNRAKLFIDNFFSYGLISILSRVIPFVFLPIITRLLPDTSDFGVFDIFQVAILLGTSFAFLGIYNPFFREYFEKDEIKYKNDVATTSFWLIFTNTCIISFLLICFHVFFANHFFNDEYHFILLISFALFISVNHDIFVLPFRIQNNRKAFLTSGLINALSQKIVAIILIFLGFSFFSLIYAMVIANIITIAYSLVKNRDFYFKGSFDKSIAKGLLKFGLPLLPITVIMWGSQSIDRMFIIKYLDLSELGVYAIGARVAQVSHLVYMAFSVGWGYFAYSTMKDKDYPILLGKIFSLSVAFITSFYFIFYLFKDIIFNILFTGDYISGVIVFPYLLIGPLMMILISILDIQTIVTKKTLFSLLINGLVFVVVIIANMILIPRFGILGAGIANVLRYFFSMLLFMIIVVKVKKLVILSHHVYWVLGIFILLFIYINIVGITLISTLSIIGYLTMVFVMYYKQMMMYFKKWKN